MNDQPTGLNIPNVMTPGAWVIVSIVAACVLGGIGFILYRWWKDRVPWKPLGFLGIEYFAQDSSFPPKRLSDAISAAISCLMNNSKWPGGAVMRVAQNFQVYVFADDKYAGKPGIGGYEAEGVIGVNRYLTTLCHELGHLCQERLDLIVDMDHSTFEENGIDKAEAAYLVWLSEQPWRNA